MRGRMDEVSLFFTPNKRASRKLCIYALTPQPSPLGEPSTRGEQSTSCAETSSPTYLPLMSQGIQRSYPWSMQAHTWSDPTKETSSLALMAIEWLSGSIIPSPPWDFDRATFFHLHQCRGEEVKILFFHRNFLTGLWKLCQEAWDILMKG